MTGRSLLAAAIGLGLALLPEMAAASDSIVLDDTCPRGFSLSSDGGCRLETIYSLYDGKEDHGGLRTRLPEPRQNFTPRQIDLGRYLFFDPILSGGGDMSCATCHDPDKGFADGLPTATGHGGKKLSRRAPTLWNVAFLKSLFWDGRADSLEQQAEGPLLSPDEMHATRDGITSALNANPVYRRLFADAFGDEAPVSFSRAVTAIAAFESTLISLNSRYDRYAHGDQDAMTPQELQGMNVFRGFVARCSQCHTPPLFTNGELAIIGAPAPAGGPLDQGAGVPLDDPEMRGAFKVPTLRNVTKTGPSYFHAGQMGSLTDVVRFYNDRRGHALPPGEHQKIHWHVHMLRPQLDETDVQSLVAFLATLEDETLKPLRPEIVPSQLGAGR